MNAMGTPTQDVVADTPQAQVFEDASGTRTYVAYNADGDAKTVTFSDGFSMDVPANALQTSNGDVTEGARQGGWDPTDPPAAPTDLTSTGHDTSSVDLSWTASTASDVAHYVVYRDGRTATEVPAGTTTAPISDLDSGTAYDFAVSAVGTNGDESVPAGPVSVTTDSDTTAPAAPSALTSPTQGSSSIDLDWDASTSGDVDHYVVSVDGSQDRTVAAGTTTASVSGLTAETTYDVSVTAVDDSGNESSPSNTVTVTTESAIGGEDWTATLTPISGSELEVEFDQQPDSDWADIHYTVDDGSQFNYRMTAQTSTHTHVIDGLSSGAVINFSFTYEEGGLAYDTASFTHRFDTNTDTAAPAAPTELASPAQTSTSVDLSWSASTSSDVVEYLVSVDGSQVQTVAAGTTNATVGDLASATSYDLSVSAVDDAGNESAAAGPITVSTDSDTTAPTVPSTLSSPGHDATSVDLSWDAASDSGSGVDHYTVYLDGETTPTVQTAATSATVSSLSADTAYDFAVTAVDAQGNESGKTSPLSVTTDSDSGGTGETFSGDGFTATLTRPASGELTFAFDHQNDSQWVDVHYTIADGGQLNYRMTAQDGSHTHTATGLSGGDTVDFSFTYEDGGLVYDSQSFSLTY